MTKIRKAAALAGLLLLCGCSDGIRTGVSGSSSAPPVEESSLSSAFDIPDVPSNAESPSLTFLGTGEPRAAAVESYAETAGISPEGAVTVMSVADAMYESRLSELISSDESPDLTEKRENTFPLLMSRNVYEDLTPFIDAAAPQWEGFSDYIGHYSLKGAHYFYPTAVKIAPELLVYDKMRCVQAGTPDPERLWEKGEWTLDAFIGYYDAINAVTGLDGCIYNGSIAENILAMTGRAFIERDGDGKFTSALGTENYLTMREFFTARRCDQSFDEPIALLQSFSAFMCADDAFLGQLRNTSLHLGIVPFPKLDGDGEYYVRAVSEGYLVPKGAKNVKNAASFINCSRIAETSEDGAKERRRELKKLGLLQSDVEWIEQIRGYEGFTPVLDEGLCLGSDANAVLERIFADAEYLVFSDYEEPSLDFSAIDSDLERINSML
ncbi:MAG: extracellular solute-binding protein [Lachnospiraceae bacterium]|nr:extracellular solute-binding protein [Ruminococcus sp.]MCM1275727.1 extracellular solute-binding protein [Lachnospiraceae bacterium]